jgi:hypothetical protein
LELRSIGGYHEQIDDRRSDVILTDTDGAVVNSPSRIEDERGRPAWTHY